VREVQYHLSKLVAELREEGEIVLARRVVKVAKLLPVGPPEGQEMVDWDAVTRDMEEDLPGLPRDEGSLGEQFRRDERY
jgi:antitoxin (DNA-binding transcriptional repressor) of toxin-antitoxin stability system